MTRPPIRPPRRVAVVSSPPEQFATPAGATLSRRAGTRQVNLRLLLPLHDRYRRLLRDCDAAGFETSLTELLHALLYAGPHDVETARRLVRDWRRVLER